MSWLIIAAGSLFLASLLLSWREDVAEKKWAEAHKGLHDGQKPPEDNP